jgi:hypothetical protein
MDDEGIDYSFLSLEEKNNRTRNGKLHIKQQKPDHWVVIPLRPIAHDIFITKFKAQMPKTSNAGFNGDIKRVCEIEEINESIRFSYKKGIRDIEE